MMTLEFADLSPYAGELSGDDDKWLAKVALINPRNYRIGIDRRSPGGRRVAAPSRAGTRRPLVGRPLHRLDNRRGSAADRPAATRNRCS